MASKLNVLASRILASVASWQVVLKIFVRPAAGTTTICKHEKVSEG